jgi:hypothetical protein
LLFFSIIPDDELGVLQCWPGFGGRSSFTVPGGHEQLGCSPTMSEGQGS